MSRNLRFTPEELAAYRAKAGGVVTHLIKDERTTKSVIETLLREISAVGLPEPELEHRFHPERKWRFDLAWVKQRVSLEVEGGIWAQGRHTRGLGFEKDCEKYNQAQLLGWTVLRYSTGQVKQGLPIEDLKRALA